MDAFRSYALDLPGDIFTILSSVIPYEEIIPGRRAAILVSDEHIPIVRTTTSYQQPAYRFQAIHQQLLDKICPTVRIPRFNNIMVEIYDERYRTMSYHSDQALDLAEDSYIAILSCYENLNIDERALYIREKTSLKSDIVPMPANSLIVFSVETNQQYHHKIFLPRYSQPQKWLGLTFRMSKTYIHFINELAYFTNGQVLTLATENEIQEFRKLRAQENKNCHFTYPIITYSLSPSDLLKPL